MNIYLEEKFSRYCYAESVKMIKQKEHERPASSTQVCSTATGFRVQSTVRA